jgi:hypothetical protein
MVFESDEYESIKKTRKPKLLCCFTTKVSHCHFEKTRLQVFVSLVEKLEPESKFSVCLYLHLAVFRKKIRRRRAFYPITTHGKMAGFIE